MAEGALHGMFAPAARWWQRVSPRLVPLLAVITALIISMLFMIFITLATTGSVDIGKQLNTTGTAYSALLEGSLGIVINNTLKPENLNQARDFLQTGTYSSRDLNRVSRAVSEIAARSDLPTLARYGEVLARYPNLTDEQIDELGTALPDIAAIGADTLEAMKPLVAGLGELSPGDARRLAEGFAGTDTLSPEARTSLEAQIPAAAGYNDEDLLAYMQIAADEGAVKLGRLVGQLDTLAAAGLTPAAADAQDLADIAARGVETIREQVALAAQIQAAGLSDPAALTTQLRLVRSLYEVELLTGPDVGAALRDDLESALQNAIVILRPNNQILFNRSGAPAGSIINNNNTPENPDDDRLEAVYLRLGGSALVFLPSNLENMITRSIPYIIAGLAVALGFKAGLFNIGAEGQLYAGGTLAAWVGFSPLFAGLPGWLHLPLVIIAGVVGGLLWGAIPGFLKAFTGAHEVISTIMLNFIAILTVDWLIKSTNPVILLDTTASTPRTPFLLATARLPALNQIPVIWFILAGALVLGWGLWTRRERIRQDARFAIRPIINGLLVLAGGLFLLWITVRGSLHLGLLVMIFAVWFTDWFLERTTLGFELRTVGANPDAARYAGMNVRLNTILALALGGALAGLAGGIVVSGVQFNMQPGFFAGVGFDGIAVALLARSSPRNMIPAGLLWGALLSGAGLMQTRADISVDLVKIIQALIIMFIAADAIIRFLWRVPEPTLEEKEKGLLAAKGWGG
ncbi:MAG: ABC transporter permease [Chloroflexi bacterium]|nr:ABC transporter permease [Chloroflexota bacterium]MDL1885771.1 ABC transporter permease [Anaerolineae bacterium CFX8]